MFKNIMNNIKIGKNQSSNNNSNSNNQTKKDKNNQSNTNNTQILTLHQQQHQQQQHHHQQQTLRAQLNQRPAQPLPDHNNKNFNQISLLPQNHSIQISQQQRTNTLNQQQNALAQHYYADIQNQIKQQQEQQQQQNRNLISNSNTLCNLNQNNINTLPRGINGLTVNSISNSLSTSAISNNLPLNDNSTLNRQIVSDGNSIYGRTFTVANQPIYNSNPMIKPIMNNFIKNNQIYGQTQQLNNNNIIYGHQAPNQNLFKDLNPNQAAIYSANNQFQISDLNQAINLNHSINSNNKWNLFDDDPGIMSEIETSSTGFRRMNKIRSSLPIVRTMSKTSDRSLGLVFLQYQNETKRTLLPNEITSFDTVKALFVRSFPRQLTMDYFEDKNNVRIYIHDQTKDMFYELEDLKDIKDRSILRIYEHDKASGIWVPAVSNNLLGKLPNGTIASNAIYGQRPNSILGFNKNDDLNYFSEPEFDTGFNQHNNIHKKRLSATFANTNGSIGPTNLINCSNSSQYYGTIVVPAQQRQEFLAKQQQQKKQLANISSTLPRVTHLISTSNIDNLNNNFKNSTPPPKPQRSLNSLSSTQPCSVDSSQNIINNNAKLSYSIIGNTLQPLNANNVIFDKNLPDRPYSVAGHYGLDTQLSLVPQMVRSYPNNTNCLTSPEKKHMGFISQNNEIFGYSNNLDSETKLKVKMMEKQIENLTGLVQNALKPSLIKDQQSTINGIKPKYLTKQKVSFDLMINNDFFNTMSNLQSKVKVLNYDLNELRKFFEYQKQQFNEFINEAKNKIYNRLSVFNVEDKHLQFRLNRFKLTREENLYRSDVINLEKNLNELELNVEKLRANVISRRCRVNMTDVENMALNLSRASKNVSDLKSKFPELQNSLKIVMTKEMQVVVDEEKFLKEEPDRLENALKRCKKLTGTLVTLKRLASVQEQRSNANKGTLEKCTLIDSTSEQENGKNADMIIQITPTVSSLNNDVKQENVLDSLLDELQTFTTNNSFEYQKKMNQSENQIHVNSNEMKIPKKHQNLQQKRSLDLGKKNVPSPPPRSSSSKINDQKQDKTITYYSNYQTDGIFDKQNNYIENEVFKQNACKSNFELSNKQIRPKSTPPENNNLNNQLNANLVNGDNKSNLNNISNQLTMVDNLLSLMPSMSTSSLSSVGSQDSIVDNNGKKNRQQLLEERHQDLLKKQKLLQEQYIRLQELSRGELTKNILNKLKKTGSESNLLVKEKTQNGMNGILIDNIHQNLKSSIQNNSGNKLLTSLK